MSDLRQAASFALTTLQGWSNHDHWLWPQSALAQAKQNTTEAISLLEAALAEPEPEGPTDADLHAMAFSYSQPCYEFEYIPFARSVLARWGKGQVVHPTSHHV